MRTTLFVAGFGSRTRARDLAYEFERYGRLVRCDVPAPKNHSSKLYAFVEFEDPRDAEDAFNEMHGRRIDGYTISVQWARNTPSASWRFDRISSPPPRRHSPGSRPDSRSYGRGPGSRSRSPYYRRRSPSPRNRSSPPYPRRRSRSRSRSPLPPRHRDDAYSKEPPRRSHSRSHSRSRSRSRSRGKATPPPASHPSPIAKA